MKPWMISGNPTEFRSHLSAATGDRYPNNGGIPHVIDK